MAGGDMPSKRGVVADRGGAIPTGHAPQAVGPRAGPGPSAGSEQEGCRLLNVCPVAFLTVDEAGVIVGASPAVAGLLGVPATELRGRAFSDHVAAADRDTFRRHCTEALSAGTQQACHVRVTPASSESFSARVESIAVRTPEPPGSRLQITLRDPSESLRVQSAVGEIENRYRALIENAHDLICEIDAEGRVLYLNPNAGSLLGRAPEERLGKSLFEHLHLDDEAAVRTQLARAVASGSAEATFRVRHEDGTWRWFEGTGTRYRTADGELRVVGIARDVTERKRAEAELVGCRAHLEELVELRTRELEASRDQVRQAERLTAIGTLAAGIAHEINNPVGAILIAARAGLRNLKGARDPEITEEALNLVAKQAERCGRIVKSILKFSHQGTSNKRYENLNDIVRAAHDILRVQVVRSGTTITRALAADLPPIRLNPTEMQQVLVNLVQNAVQAGAHEVTVRTACEDDAVCLVVADDGAGITPEQQAHLFDPFYTTRQTEGGTGLGLSITHGIVADHGGTIEIESEPGQGTSVTVRLPRAAGAARYSNPLLGRERSKS